MRTNIKHLTLNLLPSIEEIKEIKKERKVAIYGDLKWEDIRMDPQYHEYWKVVDYYVERCERIIIINGFIFHGEPSMVGSILWSDGSYDKFLQEELC